MEVDTDLQRDNDVTENASFNGLDEASEDVKMIAVETSPRKSKVCTCIFLCLCMQKNFFLHRICDSTTILEKK